MFKHPPVPPSRASPCCMSAPLMQCAHLRGNPWRPWPAAQHGWSLPCHTRLQSPPGPSSQSALASPFDMNPIIIWHHTTSNTRCRGVSPLGSFHSWAPIRTTVSAMKQDTIALPHMTATHLMASSMQTAGSISQTIIVPHPRHLLTQSQSAFGYGTFQMTLCHHYLHEVPWCVINSTLLSYQRKQAQPTVPAPAAALSSTHLFGAEHEVAILLAHLVPGPEPLVEVLASLVHSILDHSLSLLLIGRLGLSTIIISNHIATARPSISPIRGPSLDVLLLGVGMLRGLSWLCG